MVRDLEARVTEVSPQRVQGAGFVTHEHNGELYAYVPSNFDSVDQFTAADRARRGGDRPGERDGGERRPVVPRGPERRVVAPPIPTLRQGASR